MMKLIARIISTIFHPLLLPTLGILLIFSAGGHITYLPIEIKRIVFLIVVATTFLIPLSLIPLFQIFGLIDSVYMTTRRERFWPILATSISFMAGYMILTRIPFMPRFVYSFIFFTLLAVVISLSVTLFWKISIHSVGMGGISALVVILALKYNPHMLMLTAMVFILSGLVGWSRLRLDAHKPAEVYVGYVTGFFAVFLSALY